MAIQNETYLKTLFKLLLPGTIVTSYWLERYGISRNLQKYYLKAGWLASVGRGAYKKPYDNVKWQSGLNAIQKQTVTKVHFGALSALIYQGFGHFFRFDKETIHLFSPLKTKLPQWFVAYEWGVTLFHKKTSFLPNDLGLVEIEINQISIKASTPERAILECLYLAPNYIDLVECYHLFESLVNLKPKQLSELLKNCNSVKVKRLFLYMAEKANHTWLQFIETDKIDCGSGRRMISRKGVYNSKYLISIPKELSEL